MMNGEQAGMETPEAAGRAGWLADVRRQAQGRLADLPLPSALDENWRFSDRKRADVSRFATDNASVPDVPQLLAQLSPLCSDSLAVVLINGRIVQLPPEIPDGLELMPLSRTSSTDWDPFSVDWSRLGSERLACHNLACLEEGIMLRVGKGRIIEPVVEIIHIVSGHCQAVWPHTWIHVGDHARASVLERHVGIGDGEQLALGLQMLELEARSTLNYALLQQLNPESQSVNLGHARVREGACLSHLSSHQGALWSRQELVTSMLGRESRAELLSANRLDGRRTLDQRTFQDHRSPGAYSNLLYKNVLEDSAKTVFSGVIKVEAGAHETDAYQSNRNLTMSDDAESNSMPGLEILADNVRCSHGSASSAIDPDEVFYLRSRGIEEQKAQDMIAEGFLQQSGETFDHPDIRDAVLRGLYPN